MTADASASRLRWPVGLAAAAAVGVVALLFVDVLVPGTGSLAYVPLAAGAAVAGVRVGRGAARSGESATRAVALGVLGWVVLFPATFYLAFAAVQRFLLAAVPGSSEALVEFFTGFYVASLGATVAVTFLLAFVAAVAHGRLTVGRGDGAAG